jgi:hypothetical protein
LSSLALSREPFQWSVPRIYPKGDLSLILTYSFFLRSGTKKCVSILPNRHSSSLEAVNIAQSVISRFGRSPPESQRCFMKGHRNFLVCSVVTPIIRTQPCLLEIREDATFQDLSNLMDTRGEYTLLAEQLNSDGIPYWTIPTDSTPLPVTQREIWVVPKADDYILALFRTVEDDRPLYIGEISFSSQQRCSCIQCSQELSSMNMLLLDLTGYQQSQTLTEIKIFGTDIHFHDDQFVTVNFDKLKSYPTALFINRCPGKPLQS